MIRKISRWAGNRVVTLFNKLLPLLPQPNQRERHRFRYIHISLYFIWNIGNCSINNINNVLVLLWAWRPLQLLLLVFFQFTLEAECRHGQWPVVPEQRLLAAKRKSVPAIVTWNVRCLDNDMEELRELITHRGYHTGSARRAVLSLSCNNSTDAEDKLLPFNCFSNFQ